ncbi:MAG: AhpC/TSA family protein [Bacteroidaceae bacterium]|nr:AhpC/TSA family protein [Bacteroidaceae bacterium]
MKKHILLILLIIGNALMLPIKAENITIKGKIEGIKSGKLYMVARLCEDKTDTLGFCNFKKGKFELKALLEEPVVAQIFVEGYSGGFTMLAEPGVSYKAYLSNGEGFYIKGGALNDKYTAHMAKSDSLQAIVRSLQEQYKTLRESRKFRSASLVNDTLRIEQEKLKELTMKFLADNDNLISAYTMLSNIEMRDANLRETKQIYNSMGEGAKATHCGRIIQERIERMEKTAGGALAPDFTLEDVNGNPVTMSSVKGKIKIIDFWASWCGPCRLNNPALRKLYDEFHDKGLEIIGVSLDTQKGAWMKAIEKDGLNWINVSSLKGWECEIVRMYNVSGVPSLFILNEYNRIIATGLRDEQLRIFLQENLK